MKCFRYLLVMKNGIERCFHSRWYFPGVYGAIDVKHVMIRAPPDCGSDFFNYKESNSIILLAVVDDDYCFTYINIGANGRCSDGGVLQKTVLFHMNLKMICYQPVDFLLEMQHFH